MMCSMQRRVCWALLFVGVALSSRAATEGPSLGDLQRSYQMDRYTELAEHGAPRGENIFFYKCFVCHNQYAKGGPALAGLFRRDATHADERVSAVIRKGGAGMPGYADDLSEADLQDLLGYLKSPRCCYQGADPPLNPLYRATSHRWPVPSALSGGPHGQVRSAAGQPLAGMRVQVIAPGGVRTTVITDDKGHFELPVMQAGNYVLRIATPLAYLPYQRDAVHLEGGGSLEDIVLERIPTGAAASLPGTLPATAEIAAQLSGAELLWNLPGSVQEKIAFIRTCGIGCHDLKETLRNRFDESGWRVIFNWMTSRGSASAFVVRPATPSLSADAELALRWLSRVRGPGARDEPYRSFPPASGYSADVVITEYELPRRFLSMHEVSGDSKGNIWFTSHRTPIVGALDPSSGIVREYRVPDIPGMFPGTHKVAVDRQNKVWFSQNWAHRMTRLDPVTGRFRQVLIESAAPFNAGAWGNFALAPDGSFWSEHDNNTIVKIDPDSGEIRARYPLTKNPNPADDLVSADGRFWAGGAPTMGSNTAMMLDVTSGRMYETDSGDFASSAARGGFDPRGNAWFGGHTGSFIELVNEIDAGKGVHLRAFTPPTPFFPYSQYYSAMPDHNGEVWSAWVHGKGFVRLDPASGRWQVYDNAEPSAFARSTWVDNSTTPVTVWYPDYQLGTLVRIQPRH